MKKEYIAAGLMSGTSVDGIDAGLFRITLDESRTIIEVIRARTYPFPDLIRKEILDQFAGCPDALPRLTLLNMELGKLYGDCLNSLLEEARIDPSRVTVIGSHGQTMYHIGDPVEFCGSMTAGTLQLGEGSVIAQITGIPTVSDFRTADMAAGGKGAPFVPLLDRILSESFPGPAAFQNIGGIGNVGYIRQGRMIAFDTGPGNMIIDRLVEDYTNGKQHYDEDGLIGKRGHVNSELLNLWLSHPYLADAPPKTTGRELFGNRFFREYPLPETVPLEDGIRTAAVYTAKTIAQSYRQWLPEPPATVIVTGGGAHNPIIMETLKEELKESRILSGDEAGITTDFKEAAAFALMGLYHLLDIPGNEPEATGAARRVICGKLSKPLPDSGR